MAKFFFIQAIFVFLVGSTRTTCPYYIDIFNCVNINCNGKKDLTKISSSVTDLVLYEFKSDNLFCSLDLSNTGIVEISTEMMENLNQIIKKFTNINSKQKSTNIKLSFSNINRIKLLNTTANLAIFIYDSQIKFIDPKSFKNLKLELYLMNVSFTILNWVNLLNDAKLKLLNIREIEVRKPAFYDFEPIGTVSDLKLYNMLIPILDVQYFLFPLIDSVKQLEVVNCSVAKIQSSFFRKFKNIKYLTLSSNNLTKIDEFLFQELNELEFLDLDSNPIEYIHPRAFLSLKKLHTLSINLNFFKLSYNNYQWLYNSLEMKNLKDLSFRNPTVLSDFCSLFKVVKYLNRINQNLLENNFDLIHNRYSISERRLRLFGHEQISLNLNVLFNDKSLFCSIYFVCIYAKNFSSLYVNFWSLEYFNVCSEVLSMNDNIEFICEFYKKVNKCNLKPKLSSKSNNILGIPNETPLTTFFAKFNFLIFIFCFFFVMTIFFLAFFLLISLTRKKYISKNPNRRRLLKNRSQKENWLNGSFDSEYYVFLMNKNQIKI